MTANSNPQNPTTDPRIDPIARTIAAVIWRPQPIISCDIWERISDQRKRQAEDAARAVLEVIMERGIVT